MRHVVHVVVLALIAGMLTGTPAHAAQSKTLLSTRLWITPSNARSGDVISYEILVDNIGDARADRVRAELPVLPQLKILRTEFDRDTTWLSELSDDRLTVMFGRLNRGEGRRAKIYFEIGRDIAEGTQLRIRASGRFDGDLGERAHSNYTTLTIGGQKAATVPTVVAEPTATPKGGRLVFRVQNYSPAEKIFTWINAGSGVLESGLSGRSSDLGEAELAFSTRKLEPGEYSMVVFGESSKITLVVPFTIQP